MRSRRCAKTTFLILASALLAWPSHRIHAADAMPQERPPSNLRLDTTVSPEERGDLLMIRRQYMEAIDAYRHAPRDSAVVCNKLGIAYHHMHALDQAKMNYEQALMLRPKYSDALNNLGAVYYAEGDYKKAEKLYRRALKLTPHSATVYNNLGTAYFADGKLKQGINAYRAAFAIDPQALVGDPLQRIPEGSATVDRARLDFCLAEIYARAGMNEQAIEYLRKAVDAGFSDQKRLMQDEVFASIRHTAEFAQVMALAKQP
jgi:tetratricopeptide (TPR) repeat protein